MGKQYDPQVIAIWRNQKSGLLASFRKKKMKWVRFHIAPIWNTTQDIRFTCCNAFAVPGGYIYLTRGILAQFNNEAELAGVLAPRWTYYSAPYRLVSKANSRLDSCFDRRNNCFRKNSRSTLNMLCRACNCCF